jgi:hypothetical protein
MPEFSWPLLIGALLLFAVIADVFARIILKAAGGPRATCLYRVPKGNAWCPACGTNVPSRQA